MENITLLVVPEGCKARVTLNNTTTQTAYEDPLSVQAENTIDFLKSAILIPVFFGIGASGNVCNMIIFFKLGLKDRINLGLFSLAFVDFGFLNFLFLLSIDFIKNPFKHIDKYGPLARSLVENYIFGMYGLSYGSIFISVILACERCFCVLFPLRAKTLLKTKTMGVIIVLGVCATTLPRSFVLAKYKPVCFINSDTRVISYVVAYSDFYVRYKSEIDGLDWIFYGIVMTLGCPALVLVTTVATCVNLRQIMAWRQQTSSSARKDIAVTKMLVYLSVQFLILTIPHICIRVFPLFMPELSGGGRLRNSYFVITSLGELSFCLHSAGNTIIYYIAGSRYRQCFHLTFCTNVSTGVANKHTAKTFSKT